MGKNLKLMIAFTPQVNVYLNKSSIQLQIIDFQILNETENQQITPAKES